MQGDNEQSETKGKGSLVGVLLTAILATTYTGTRKIIRARRELTPHRNRRVYTDSRESPLTLVGLNIIDVSYDDGDLFWGHSIVVSGSVPDGPTRAGIHG